MTPREIEALLPWVFRRTATGGSPLAALTAVMSAFLAPAERAVADLDIAFDPRRTADDLVPLLARWVDLERLLEESPAAQERGGARPLLPTGLGRLRELVANAAVLSQWRGTARGLLLFLEIATGCPGFAVEEEVVDAAGRVRPFHLRVVGPAAAAPYRALVDRIIQMEKPAYVTYELALAAERSAAV